MIKIIIFTLLSLVFMGSPQAQMRKCTATDGRITYSDAPCNTSSKSVQNLDISTSGGYSASPLSPPSQGGGVFEREISGKIAGYLAQDDFDHAATLAVTAEHFKMIADARQRRQLKETTSAAEFVPNKYECERVTRNAEVAAKGATKKIRDSVLDREMNIVCFGPDRAGQIEQARASAPNVTVINPVSPIITHCAGVYCYDSRGKAIFMPNR